MKKKPTRVGVTMFVLRRGFQVTQRFVAREMDVSRSLVSAVERGVISPSREYQKAWCQVFGLSLDQLGRISQAYQKRLSGAELRSTSSRSGKILKMEAS